LNRKPVHIFKVGDRARIIQARSVPVYLHNLYCLIESVTPQGSLPGCRVLVDEKGWRIMIPNSYLMPAASR